MASSDRSPNTGAPTPSLLIGVAGWAYPDWEGVFYPQGRSGKSIGRLAFLARYVDLVEVNASFYRIPPARQAEQWLAAVADRPRFRFTLKLWQGFTHGAADLRGPEAAAFCELAQALDDGKRLAATLAQFPWSFKYGPAEMDHIRRLSERFGRDRPLVVEVRHRSWMRQEYLDMLRALEVGFCNIDQPVIGESLEPSALVTAAPAYVRLHGRRYDTWFAEGVAPHERYNYLYGSDVLNEWARRVAELTPRASPTLVIANNHFRGKAVAAALELKSRLEGEPPPAPASLLNVYPDLKKRCRTDREPDGPAEQLELF